jgi:hypothetical protein
MNPAEVTQSGPKCTNSCQKRSLNRAAGEYHCQRTRLEHAPGSSHERNLEYTGTTDQAPTEAVSLDHCRFAAEQSAAPSLE